MRGWNRVGWAVAASVAVHVLLTVAGLVLTRRTDGPPASTTPRIDTRVGFTAARTPEPQPPPPVVAVPEPEPPPPDPPPDESPAPPPVEDARPPLVRAVVVPSALPAELLARVRAFTPVPAKIDTDVRPAAAVATARPAHGALAAGQRVVYLLDASGSMGEWGKFDAARDAVAATAALQPAGVDVNVVVYAAAAEVLSPAALAARSPAGRGDHLAGVRAALECRPDFVVWLTDADDLPAAAVRNVVRRAGRPVRVLVARVGAAGVAAPVELR